MAIVDYGMGNLYSVQQACRAVGIDAEITADRSGIAQAGGVILPGVGAFGSAMEALRKLDLIDPIRDVARGGNPLLGVCLGQQLIMTKSEEFGDHDGLGILKGSVVQFRQPQGPAGPLKVPQVCWNSLQAPERRPARWRGSILDGLREGAYVYFVHSYYVVSEGTEDVLATTRYGDVEFVSAVSRDNVSACQFHPERSGVAGLHVYQNFARAVARRALAAEL